MVGSHVALRVRGRRMEAEGKLGGGGWCQWWMRVLGASCDRARACASSPLASSIPNPDPVVKCVTHKQGLRGGAVDFMYGGVFR